MYSAERIKQVAKKLASQVRQGDKMLLVVSAMGKTTDELLKLIASVSCDPERRETDQALATGEMISASLMAMSLREAGLKASSFNAFNLGLRGDFLEGEYSICGMTSKNRLNDFFKKSDIAVVAGFQALNEDNDLVTLGRGGSDLTAVFMAKELGQKLCEKYTDEDGIYTADPSMIAEAEKRWHLDYEEMAVLADYGNKILHPRSIEMAKQNSIRIHVRSSFSDLEGSVIGPEGDPEIKIKSLAVTEQIFYAFVKGKEVKRSFQTEKLPFKPLFLGKLEEGLAIGYSSKDSFEAVLSVLELAEESKALSVDNTTNLTTLTLSGNGLESFPYLADKCLQQVLSSGIEPKDFEHAGKRLSFAVTKESASKLAALLNQIAISNSG